MTTDAIVAINDLSVTYGPTIALDGVSLRIPQDAGVIGLFGPNGAGKSTMLRTVCGDIGRYKGTVTAPSRSNIAYLPDAPFLYSWLSVKQCSELYEHRYTDFRKEVFDEFLTGSKVTTASRVSALSKGMSERLHLALIMSRAPELYVLDEPLGGVDPLTRDHLLHLIMKYRSDHAPLILSTHLINGVDQVFDNVVLISDGNVLANDSAASLRDRGDGDLELAYKRIVSEL
ncbi:ATP-binding cassette domain-containing protein [Devriesea agamarum]|uniref:ATP-binding cassette domain-containing protein n=1 Tax=Devriesea agamarum TaxID=472569 RepID=UPI00071D8967|nr:ABC transporter ATP-binding protein [Devriesea agamarum]